MILQLLSVFIGVIGFGIILEVPKKYLVYSGIAGAIGWAANLLCQMLLPVGSVFFSSFCIALISQIFARKLKCPVTVFLIPGIYPFVPGAGIYRTVYYVIVGSNTIAGHFLIETLTTAGMIALGIYIVDIFWKMRKVN